MTRGGEAKTGASDARERILAAAEALACERGPGNISIEAVAGRAGLSKGGVLYHFRTKAELLTALVAAHIDLIRGQVEACRSEGAGPNAMAEALVGAHMRLRTDPLPAPAGVLAAVAEHPDFLDPLRAYHAETVRRLRQESGDPELATIAYLALEGLKALHLFGFDLLDREEEDALLRRMESLLRNSPARS